MTIALYTADGPLACLGSDRMLADLAVAAEAESSLSALCSDGSTLADAGLADAAIKTGTAMGIVLGAALKSARIIMPCVCWIDEWQPVPERAVVNVETPVSVSVPGKTELAAPDLCAALAELAAVHAATAESNRLLIGALARLADGVGKLKIEAHFHAGDVKPIVVGGGDKQIKLESVEL